MPHVVRRIVNDVDVGKSDHADNENAKGHRQQSLNDNARPRADDERCVSGPRFLQVHLSKSYGLKPFVARLAKRRFIGER
jgi:hypothetical protein